MSSNLSRTVGLASVLVCTLFGCSDAESDETTASNQAPLSGGFLATAETARTIGVVHLWNGCTAARVGPYHLLTAAHCVGGYRPGSPLWITQSAVADDSALWEYAEAWRVDVHPGYTARCSGLVGTCTYSTPSAPDVALIMTDHVLPSTIGQARIGTARLFANGYATQVLVTGYGCEHGLGGPAPSPPRLGIVVGHVLPASEVDPFLSAAAPRALFDATYLLTPGASGRYGGGGASLCPGDSGGPLMRLTSPFPGGPSYLTNVVVGVNADYTFNGSGLSEHNLHTRLSNEAPHYVTTWLRGRLPASAFVDGTNP